MSSRLMTLREDIENELQDEGLVVNSDQDQLVHLWSIYQRTKNKLKSTLESIEFVQKQFTDGTEDLQSYVEHITKLSEEREALVREIQNENDDLRIKIEEITLQLALFRDSETRDMLLQNGLEEIVDCRPREKIAFLLVDRARLMDELDELRGPRDRKSNVSQLKATSEYRVCLDGSRRGVDVDDFPETSWAKLKELLEKVDDLESANEHLMQRLKVVAPEEYAQIVAAETQRAATKPSNSRPKLSDFIQKKPFVAPKTLDEAISRLEAAEEKAAEAEFLRVALKERSLDRHLDDTINDEESFASLLCSPRGGATVDRQNADLQSALAAVEAHLQQLVLNSSGAGLNSAVNSEMNSAKFTAVQKDFDRVKTELVKMFQKYDSQRQKHTKQKLAAKNKLHSVQENFRLERVRLTEQVESLENELALMKVTLAKEMEYKENMEKSHHTLLLEQRELHAKLTESEERSQDQTRELTVLKVRMQCFEEDNTRLLQQCEMLNKQRSNLERLVKQPTDKRVSVTINTERQP